MADQAPPVDAGPAPEAFHGSLPLQRGDCGGPVADLQQRLAAIGIDVKPREPHGEFGAGTETAVRVFQQRRGLSASGVCDRQTWSALVEAGHQLGDRFLYRRTPMLRGDDVAELQRRMSTLGFDPGRIDGIFGDETADALRDFQRNAGLPVDGICGRRTLSDLERLHPRPGGSDLVSPVRELLNLRRTDPGLGSGGLGTRRIVVVEPGGFAAAATAVCRALREAGATALELHHPDPSLQASEANAANADCVVALQLLPDRTTCTTAYYRGFRYESVASRRLAELIQRDLPAVLGLEGGGIAGMALPILRETRMPAVELQLGSPLVVVQRTAALAATVVSALSEWISSDWD